MIAPIKQPRRSTKPPAWHTAFLAMLPAITRQVRVAFRHLPPEAKDEAIQEAICNSCVAFARLAELDKLDLAYPSVLARYAVAQVRDGRKVGGRLNIRDVMSEHCQRCKDITVERLDRFDPDEDAWAEAVVADTRSAPVPDTVAFRCDFRDWLDDLPPRSRRITESLALGNRTGEVARRFRVSPGKISQLRRELHQDWQRFENEESSAAEPASC